MTVHLIKGETYTTPASDILVTILNIGYRCPKYTKAKIMISNKHNPDIIYERTGYLKLIHTMINDWKISYDLH